MLLLHTNRTRSLSSAGSEHYLDRVGVTGSNPVGNTIPALPSEGLFFMEIVVNGA